MNTSFNRIAALVLLSLSVPALAENRGDFVNQRLDARGDRVERRVDRRRG